MTLCNGKAEIARLHHIDFIARISTAAHAICLTNQDIRAVERDLWIPPEEIGCGDFESGLNFRAVVARDDSVVACTVTEGAGG